MTISNYDLEILTTIFVASSLYLDFVNQFNNEDLIKDILKARILITVFYIILVSISNS